MDTGPERFNPEWLFRTPGKIEGPLFGPKGDFILSIALSNVRAAYALDTPYLQDSDNDGFPDRHRPRPRQTRLPRRSEITTSPRRDWLSSIRPSSIVC